MNDVSSSINQNDYILLDDNLYFFGDNKPFQTNENANHVKDEDFSPKKRMSSKQSKNLKAGKEASYIKKVLKNFDFKTSITWKKIQELYSTGVRHTELISIAEILILKFGLPNISRSCHRSFPVLIKWFDDNWEKIEPYICNILLLDEQKHLINLSREIYDQIK